MGAMMIVGVVMMVFMTGGKMPIMDHGATAQPAHSSAQSQGGSMRTDENAQTPVTNSVTPGASN